MAQTQGGPSPALAAPVLLAMSELDELVALVTGMLRLFCGEPPADAAASKLQAFGQQYQAKSAQLRTLIQQVAQAAARQATPPAADVPMPRPVEDIPTEVSAELEGLRLAATEKNRVLFKLITQLRDLLDSIVMWETFNKNLANDAGKKQDRK